MLNFRGMFESTIDDSSEAFRLENEVLETGGMDSYIVTPDLRCWRK